MIDTRLAVLQIGSFMRGELAGLNSLADPLLLILRPHSRPRECSVLRMSTIHRSKIAPIGMRHLHVVLLLCSRTNMGLPRVRCLLHTRMCLNPTRAAIEARAVDHRRVDDRPVHIRIVDGNAVHIHHCGVIGKTAAYPTSAAKSDATVAEAIVHAAIEADMRPPVSGVEEVRTTTPAPVTRRPEHAHLWRPDPHTRNPVVALIAIRPVAWVPEIAISGAKRLCVNRQHRRRNRYRNKDPGKRRRRHKRESRANKNFTDQIRKSHTP